MGTLGENFVDGQQARVEPFEVADADPKAGVAESRSVSVAMLGQAKGRLLVYAGGFLAVAWVATAFAAPHGRFGQAPLTAPMIECSLALKTVPTQPIAGQKPGTSGLRKKTKVRRFRRSLSEASSRSRGPITLVQ